MAIRPALHSSLIILACTFSLARGAVPERRRCEIPVLTQGPALAGDLSAPQWAQGAVLDGFRLLAGKGTPAAQTEARVLADDKCLYVGVVCHEPSMDQVVTEITQPGGNVWTADCVEVLVDPTNAKAFHHHVIVNSKGIAWQGLHSVVGSLPRRDEAVSVRTALGEKRWSCELAIPLALLGAALRPGELWGLNVARERKAGQSEVSSWQEATMFTDPTQLGEALIHPAGADVLDASIPLAAGPPRRYVRISLAARAAGALMSLVEAELWGNRAGQSSN